MDVHNWIQDGIAVLTVIAVPIGTLVIWRFHTLSKAIEKDGEALDAHIKEGIQVHRALERIETKIDLHMKNGGKHSKGRR